MTDEHFDEIPEMRLSRDEFIDLMTKASLIAVEGPLHRFVPQQPAWCLVLGNKVGRVVRKHMTIPWDEARALAAIQKYARRLNYVYGIAATRHQAHLAKRRLRRQQAKAVSKKATLTVVDGVRSLMT